MTSKDIRDLTSDEITVRVRTLREELLQLRLRKQTGQVEKTDKLRTLRKDIARMLTIQNEKKSQATVAA